jgi:tetrahydromethanopterin S-methyltransferase subunit G
MAIGKIYDTDEATRIQAQLNALNKPFEVVSENKQALNKKVETGLYIMVGIVGLTIMASYFFTKKKK